MHIQPIPYKGPRLCRRFLPYGNMMAALVMAAVPAIIVYIALQKYSTGGVAAGGVKS